MSETRKIYKPRPVTGFPEWLPEVRLVEQQWFDHIRRVFESYGFCNIETPSIEELDVLRAKGEVDKEIYVIERLHKDENDKGEARLALHFDQTVPLARYVAQNFNDLVFPFKRYQMQRVWRGERPQKGRFREFYQCDIDVIGVDNLPLHFDAEMPAIMWEVMSGLPGMENEKIQIQVSNRKILIGLLESAGVTNKEQVSQILRILDKSEKIDIGTINVEISKILKDHPGEAEVFHLLGLFRGYVAPEFKTRKEKIRYARELNIDNQTYKSGVDELESVLNYIPTSIPEEDIVVNFMLVRGLDYYTGTVYETVFLDDPGYGSICSGGRYDDLAGSYINKNLPGVGISIGFSRLFARMVDQNKLPLSAKSPAHVMMILPAEEQRENVAAVAQILRKRGINVEMLHAAKKIPDQLKYASRKGIPYVWFVEADGSHQVKDMLKGEQTTADPKTWKPEGSSLHAVA